MQTQMFRIDFEVFINTFLTYNFTLLKELCIFIESGTQNIGKMSQISLIVFP